MHRDRLSIWHDSFDWIVDNISQRCKENWIHIPSLPLLAILNWICKAAYYTSSQHSNMGERSHESRAVLKVLMTHCMQMDVGIDLHKALEDLQSKRCPEKLMANIAGSIIGEHDS